jgi:phosphoglycolate phosphatase
MPLPRPDVVIFDMDGTTVRHLRPWVLQLMEVTDDLIYRVRRICNALGLTKLKLRRSTKKPRLIGHRMLHKIRRKPVEEIVEPCPGVIELLELLRDHGVKTGLVSNGLGKGYGHDILDKFGLAPLFATTVFREDIVRSKPDPEMLLAALSQINLPLTPESVVWYIGDRAKDITAAVATTHQVTAQIIPIGYGLPAAVALFDQGYPSKDNVVLSYEDWYDTVAGILGTLPAAPAA